jgi:hypothetical protein
MAGRKQWLAKVLKPDSGAITASIGWLEKFLTPEADRSERRTVEQFAAYRWNGSAVAEDMVRDISSSGLFLITEERWEPGTILALTLQRQGELDRDPARRITTQVRVVRPAKDGVGLTFLWTKDDPKSRQWESLLESLIQQTKPGDMVSLARMVESFAFLGRICPDGVDEIGEWVGTRASSHKILNAVSIALKAERMLVKGGLDREFHLDPKIAVRILEVGSGTDEDWLHGLWGGLLITAVSPEGRETNLKLVEILSQLTTIPIRIFTVVCTKAEVTIHGSEVKAKPLTCNLEKLATIVGARGPQMQREIESLRELRLIEAQKTQNSSALLASQEIQITPTTLGLELFARSNGHRGSLRELYLQESSKAAATGT